MPPHLRSTSPTGVDYLPLFIQPDHLLKSLLLLALVVTVVRSLLLLRTLRKNRMADADSLPDGQSSHARPVTKKRDSGNAEEKDMASPRMYPPLHANQYLQSLRQEALQPQLIPIHPWIAPPTPLPGPYDAPYYPLPLPTIRNDPEQFHSDSNTSSMTTSRRESTNSVSSNESETLTTRSYTRRLSENAKLPYDPVLEGSTTVSSAGWRRTQWSVSAG